MKAAFFIMKCMEKIMLKDKKYLILRIIEWVMPWLVLIGGIPAIYSYNKTNRLYYEYYPIWSEEVPADIAMLYERMNDLFHVSYRIAMWTGVIAVAIEIIIGTIGLVTLIINASDKKPVKESVILWLSPFLFVAGTLLLMFIVLVFTYGIGV